MYPKNLYFALALFLGFTGNNLCSQTEITPGEFIAVTFPCVPDSSPPTGTIVYYCWDSVVHNLFQLQITKIDSEAQFLVSKKDLQAYYAEQAKLIAKKSWVKKFKSKIFTLDSPVFLDISHQSLKDSLGLDFNWVFLRMFVIQSKLYILNLYSEEKSYNSSFKKRNVLFGTLRIRNRQKVKQYYKKER